MLKNLKKLRVYSGLATELGLLTTYKVVVGSQCVKCQFEKLNANTLYFSTY